MGRLSFDEAIAPDAPSTLARLSWSEDGRRIRREHNGQAQWIDPFTGEPFPGENPEIHVEATGPDDLQRRLASDLVELSRPGDTGQESSAVRLDRARAAVRQAQHTEDRSVWVIQYDGDLFVYQKDGDLRSLGTTPEEERLATLAPDGSAVSFVRDHDLWCHFLADDREVAVTDDGGQPPLDGELDWVYQEEVYGRGKWRAQWWSPDGRTLAFLRLDIAATPTYTLLDHRHDVLESEQYGYPHPGEPNPAASLWMVRPGERPVAVDPVRYENQDTLIVSVTWSPAGRLIYQVQDRLQTWLELLSADPDTGDTTLLLREESSTWVDSPGAPTWLADGSFLWRSESSGHWRILHCSADGSEQKALSGADRDAVRIVHVDEDRQLLWYMTRDLRGIGAHLMRVSLGGGEPLRLTRGSGTHRVELNHDGTFFLDWFSAHDHPPEVRLCRGDGTVQNVLARTPRPHPAAVVDTELLSVPGLDGYPLDVLVRRPPRFHAKRAYPVLMRVYGGPGMPVFRDRWQNRRWHRFLTEQGIVIVEVNNRTSSGRGKAVHELCYQKLGAMELRDYEAVAGWLGRQPWADTTRIGIQGHSYGGFMTAYALTHSNLFRLGIAESGVYDWRHYDSIYTERFMRTPEENPEGYAQSSCVAAARDLQGHLVLLHGALDDNVHAHNTLRLADALQKAHRRFDLMIYPGAGHGLGGTRAHRYEIIWRALREHLLETTEK